MGLTLPPSVLSASAIRAMMSISYVFGGYRMGGTGSGYSSELSPSVILQSFFKPWKIIIRHQRQCCSIKGSILEGEHHDYTPVLPDL